MKKLFYTILIVLLPVTATPQVTEAVEGGLLTIFATMSLPAINNITMSIAKITCMIADITQLQLGMNLRFLTPAYSCMGIDLVLISSNKLLTMGATIIALATDLKSTNTAKFDTLARIEKELANIEKELNEFSSKLKGEKIMDAKIGKKQLDNYNTIDMYFPLTPIS